MILAVDTTHEFGSLALVQQGVIVDEVSLHSPEGFGQVLFGQISRLLERQHTPLTAIDCFAAASGPGSFTGVRVGLACVKGLGEANGRLVLGVSNLQALSTFGAGRRRAVILDARRGEIYGAVYDDEACLVREETVTNLPDWLASLPNEPYDFVSPSMDFFAPALAASRFAACPRTHAPRTIAGAIGQLAERIPGVDPAALDANYVRRSDAELLWRDRG
ncbi:MAG: tRNA (adenosine(37)-N6)-threonylcarbamoyltransferase complex dimerization subunit type 1 TsaB [Bryobacteraceae bacterium]